MDISANELQNTRGAEKGWGKRRGIFLNNFACSQTFFCFSMNCWTSVGRLAEVSVVANERPNLRETPNNTGKLGQIRTVLAKKQRALCE